MQCASFEKWVLPIKKKNIEQCACTKQTSQFTRNVKKEMLVEIRVIFSEYTLKWNYQLARHTIIKCSFTWGRVVTLNRFYKISWHLALQISEKTAMWISSKMEEYLEPKLEHASTGVPAHKATHEITKWERIWRKKKIKLLKMHIILINLQ